MASNSRSSEPTPETPVSPGRFAYEGLDRVLHEKARLGMMTSLITRPEGLSFTDLKELCSLSDGNLNRHLAVLQDAGFIQVRKQGAGRGSKTHCRVTAAGKKHFLSYLAELERVIADAEQATASRRTSSSRLELE